MTHKRIGNSPRPFATPPLCSIQIFRVSPRHVDADRSGQRFNRPPAHGVTFVVARIQYSSCPMLKSQSTAMFTLFHAGGPRGIFDPCRIVADSTLKPLPPWWRAATYKPAAKHPGPLSAAAAPGAGSYGHDTSFPGSLLQRQRYLQP